jgi:hypothetical protein
MAERLTPDQLEIDEVELGKQRREGLEEAHCNTAAGTRDDEEEPEGERSAVKKLKEESVQSIRDLIKQELKSL